MDEYGASVLTCIYNTSFEKFTTMRWRKDGKIFKVVIKVAAVIFPANPRKFAEFSYLLNKLFALRVAKFEHKCAQIVFSQINFVNSFCYAYIFFWFFGSIWLIF